MVTRTQRAATAEPPRHRFTVDEYHRMIEAGVLDADDRVELVDGEVVEMSAMGAQHVNAVEYLDDELRGPLEGRARVRAQLPVTIPDFDEPEPDISVVRLRPDRYRGIKPGPEDILLLIEISDATLAYDVGVKMPRYASAGIPETWIVDLTARGDAIYRHSDPVPEEGRYRTVTRFGRDEHISSVVLPGLSLPVDEILGSGEPGPSRSA